MNLVKLVNELHNNTKEEAAKWATYIMSLTEENEVLRSRVEFADNRARNYFAEEVKLVMENEKLKDKIKELERQLDDSQRATEP